MKVTYELIHSYLKILLENDRDLEVIDIVNSDEQLIEKLSQNKTDVVLICLMEDEGRNLTFLNEVFNSVPKSKVVILYNPNSSFDQTEALKLGVTGIVGTNQSPRVLTRAIKQVSEGDVWLNQKLIAKLISGNDNIESNKNGGGIYNDDELTAREIEVVEMIALGLKNKDISDKLYISEATVRHHLSSIYSKLNIDDRLNLAIYAFQKGIDQTNASVH